jgi:hypothetical protein
MSHQYNLANNDVSRVGITDQHYALIIIPLFITQAPTCFNTYVPSSGSVLYPCELLESEMVVSSGCTHVLKIFVASVHRMLFCALLCLAEHLDKVTHNYNIWCHITSVVLLLNCLQTSLFISIEDNS